VLRQLASPCAQPCWHETIAPQLTLDPASITPASYGTTLPPSGSAGPAWLSVSQARRRFTHAPVAACVLQVEHADDDDEAQGPPSVLGQLSSMQVVNALKSPCATPVAFA
jgi:hypothetical protein